VRQLPEAAGIDVAREAASSSALVPQVLPALLDAAHALAAADPRALFLAALVPAAVFLVRRVDARLPAALAALVVAAAVAHALGWDAGVRPLAPVGALPSGWPLPAWPGLVDPGPLAAPALAIALLSTVQTMAAARTIAPPGFRLDPDRELFAQGLGNLVAGFTGALPTSGSLSRSALVRAAGGSSRLAAAGSGVALLLGLPLVAPFVAHVPSAALAGLVILSGLDLVDSRILRRSAATRGDALVLLATLGATLWLDLVQAVYVGVFLSLALLVRRSGRLQLVEIVSAGANRFREIPTDERTGSTPAVLLHLEGDLNFAVAPELAERLDEIAERDPRVVVLRLKRARHLDATVLEVLRAAFARMRRRGSEVILCGLTDPIAEVLERTELGRELGPEGLLRAGPRLFEGFERALARAREILRPRSDAEIFRREDPIAWTWEI
jgi:SulP family sulfate permease